MAIITAVQGSALTQLSTKSLVRSARRAGSKQDRSFNWSIVARHSFQHFGTACRFAPGLFLFSIQRYHRGRTCTEGAARSARIRGFWSRLSGHRCQQAYRQYRHRPSTASHAPSQAAIARKNSGKSGTRWMSNFPHLLVVTVHVERDFALGHLAERPVSSWRIFAPGTAFDLRCRYRRRSPQTIRAARPHSASAFSRRSRRHRGITQAPGHGRDPGLVQQRYAGSP